MPSATRARGLGCWRTNPESTSFGSLYFLPSVAPSIVCPAVSHGLTPASLARIEPTRYIGDVEFTHRPFMKDPTSRIVFADPLPPQNRLQHRVRFGRDPKPTDAVAEVFSHGDSGRLSPSRPRSKVGDVQVRAKVLDANLTVARALDRAGELQTDVAAITDSPAQIANRRATATRKIELLVGGHRVKQKSELVHKPDSVSKGNTGSIPDAHLRPPPDLYHRDMNIHGTRRRALQALIDRRFGGVQSRFGMAIGRQSDYVSRLVHGHKLLGERLAREIEVILGLDVGELDRDPPPLNGGRISRKFLKLAD